MGIGDWGFGVWGCWASAHTPNPTPHTQQQKKKKIKKKKKKKIILKK